ncbi:DUF1566 domain-containing protein [bacterium]|nr:DUF1566 domain-containing protein [bacterium]
MSILDSGNISCYGINDGYIQVGGSGGAGVYHYSLQIYNSTFNYWQQIGQSPLGNNFTYANVTFPVLTAQCYQIVLDDPLGCRDTVQICLTQPDPLQVFTTITPSTSNLINDGSIIIDSVLGGVPPYTYSWNGPSGFSSNNQSITGLQSGTYSLNLVDDNSCIYTQNYDVNALIPGCTDSTASNYNPLANINDSSCCYILLNQNDTIICQGESVVLDLDLSSSTYLWNTGETTSSITVSPLTSSFFWVTTDNSCYNSIIIFVNPLSNSTTSATSCDSYSWDGVVYSSTGQYSNVYTDINGCDSTVTLDLTINNSDTTNTSATSCNSYTWDGVVYTTSGQYSNLYNNQNGCDSLVILDLTINNSDTTNITVTSCNSYTWDALVYTSSGQYSNLYTNQSGCDSLVILDLTITNSDTTNTSAVSCDSYTWDGVVYTTSGQYSNLYNNQNGCDSLVILDLTINNSDTTNTSVTSCDSYTWDGVVYTTSGLYTNVYTGLNGCDSTVTLNLILTFSDTLFINITACDSLDWYGNNYTQTGTYIHSYFPSIGTFINGGFIFHIDSISNIAYVADSNFIGLTDWGCNSTAVYGADSASIGYGYQNTLDIINSSCVSSTDAAMLCYNYSNFYSDWYLPSLEELELIRQNLFVSGYVNYNTGDVNNWYWSSTECQSNQISDASNVNFSGSSIGPVYCNNKNSFPGGVIPVRQYQICDSIIVLNLTINNSDTTNTSAVSCDSYTWDGVVYTLSGQYSNLYTNQSGCDSTVTLDLTINNSDTLNTTVTSCDSYTWDGVVYTLSGQYSNVYTNQIGCDSTVILDLSILNSFSSTFLDTSCDSYTWDGVTYDSTGQYTNTYTASNGCDSTVTLDLLINISGCMDPSALNYNPLAVCSDSCIYAPCNISVLDSQNITCFGGNDGYIQVGGTGGVGLFHYSIQIFNSTFGIWQQIGQSPLGGGFTYAPVTFTSLYADCYKIIMDDSLGCLDTVDVCLTEPSENILSVTLTSCDSYTWDGVVYTLSGQYVNVYTDLNGCDSTVTLDLTINNSDTLNTTVTSCDSYTWDGVVYTLSGQYSNVYTNQIGCDSTVILDLTINSSDTLNTTATACDSYIWDGVIYTSSGQFSNLYTNHHLYFYKEQNHLLFQKTFLQLTFHTQ